MQDIIQALREIDVGASQVMKSTEEEKAALKNDYETRIKETELKIHHETQERLNVLESQLDAQVSNEILKMKEDASRNLESLDNNYKANHDQYVETIFQKIIEV